MFLPYSFTVLCGPERQDKREACICNGFYGPGQLANFILYTSRWPGA